ncbi:GntR family transcriptional regulator [Secundilactobacillus folii]|uniref:GntR family transcriptional regulator n=1 Tax=Secundilactobacillus folii TaxID=2678357 RepID=A0A7X2XX68_9LACO|nr:GntR family transcriptional regulator [Secundilactobacillus folii]MTV83302.1 GntR family transcriptional regulator [Secundilactobacillus folii]
MKNIDSMRDDAYQQIKYKIIHFEFMPGQKISEKTLSTEFHLGRTPVREALIRIEREGLIQVIPQSGTYITPIDMSEAEEGRFVRECIEPKIMMNAAVSITPASVAFLRNNLERQRITAENSQPDAFFDLDQSFHHEFYHTIGKDLAWDWLQINNTQLNRYRRLRLKELELDWNTLLNQHRQIFKSLMDKRLDDLNYFMAEHLHLMLVEKQKVLDAYPDYFVGYEK